MPFKSEAQRRWMHAAEARGELEPGTAARWQKHTKKQKKALPERVKDEKQTLRKLKRAKGRRST